MITKCMRTRCVPDGGVQTRTEAAKKVNPVKKAKKPVKKGKKQV